MIEFFPTRLRRIHLRGNCTYTLAQFAERMLATRVTDRNQAPLELLGADLAVVLRIVLARGRCSCVKQHPGCVRGK